MLKSKVKKLAKDLLLPTIRRLTKSKKLSTVYSSYEAAIKQADGFEDPALTKVVVAKGKIFASNLVNNKNIDLMALRSVLGVASALTSKTLKVVDFGGAAGAHYFIAKSILGKEIIIDWRVVETPAMANEAIKQGLQNDELSFYSSIESATCGEEFDLVFASSSVHYTPRPYDVIRSLLSVKSKKFVLTRTAISNSEKVLLQKSTLSGNGIGPIPEELSLKDKTISYPVTVLSKNKVEDVLCAFGEIQLHLKEDRAVLRTATESFDYFGYIVTKHPLKTT